MVLNSSHSDYSSIESGVAPGSVLGPLFLIYDLERNIKSNIKFFADDTIFLTYFSSVKDPEISANDLNHDLDTICQWISGNLRI